MCAAASGQDQDSVRTRLFSAAAFSSSMTHSVPRLPVSAHVPPIRLIVVREGLVGCPQQHEQNCEK